MTELSKRTGLVVATLKNRIYTLAWHKMLSVETAARMLITTSLVRDPVKLEQQRTDLCKRLERPPLRCVECGLVVSNSNTLWELPGEYRRILRTVNDAVLVCGRCFDDVVGRAEDDCPPTIEANDLYDSLREALRRAIAETPDDRQRSALARLQAATDDIDLHTIISLLTVAIHSSRTGTRTSPRPSRTGSRSFASPTSAS